MAGKKKTSGKLWVMLVCVYMALLFMDTPLNTFTPPFVSIFWKKKSMVETGKASEQPDHFLVIKKTCCASKELDGRKHNKIWMITGNAFPRYIDAICIMLWTVQIAPLHNEPSRYIFVYHLESQVKQSFNETSA